MPEIKSYRIITSHHNGEVSWGIVPPLSDEDSLALSALAKGKTGRPIKGVLRNLQLVTPPDSAPYQAYAHFIPVTDTAGDAANTALERAEPFIDALKSLNRHVAKTGTPVDVPEGGYLID